MTSPRNPDPLIADIYCRLSLAIMGDTTKVDDQERIGREIAARRGWTVGQVHKDNSVSAWQKNRKRKGWDAMLRRVRDGVVGAIVCYHGDRLIRQPYDLEVLLNLADKQGIRQASVMGERDLDNPDDRYILRIEAASACRESDSTSRRVRAHIERRRRQGLTRSGGRGGRTTGFATDGVTHIEAECEYIRKAATRISAGDSTGWVARERAASGWVTPAGNPVTLKFLRDLLRLPRLAGLMPDGKTRAAWEPVLGRELWEDTVAVLDRRAAMHPPQSNARVHLLSGIALCGTCRQPAQAQQAGASARRPPHRGYGCMNRDCVNRVYRSQAHLDEYVTETVLGLLNDDRFIRGIAAPASADAAQKIIMLEQRREAARLQLAQLADHPELDVALIAESLASFTTKIYEERGKMATSARARLVLAHQGLTREGWDALPLGTQRALVTGTVTVVIKPATRRGPGFDPASVEVTPR